MYNQSVVLQEREKIATVLKLPNLVSYYSMKKKTDKVSDIN